MIAGLVAQAADAEPLGSCPPAQFHLLYHPFADGVCFLLRQGGRSKVSVRQSRYKEKASRAKRWGLEMGQSTMRTEMPEAPIPDPPPEAPPTPKQNPNPKPKPEPEMPPPTYPEQ